MTDGRFDSRHSQREQRGRGNDPYDRSGGDDRGFFDRARDEVSSWFGDDDAERRRERDHGPAERGFERGTGMSEPSYDRFERSARYRDEGYRRPYTGRSAGSGFGGGYGGEAERGFGERGLSDTGFGDTSFGGRGRDRGSMGRNDPDYSQWRSRQIEELDRDYEDFRRENQSRFDSEFTTWRGQRQAKRQLIGGVTEHMEVVGSDGEPVGKVDWVKGDKLVLTKNDSPDGRHHLIACSQVDRIEDGKVMLDCTAEEAKRRFARQGREPAMFERERERDRDDGPHMLNRSFSGTY